MNIKKLMILTIVVLGLASHMTIDTRGGGGGGGFHGGGSGGFHGDSHASHAHAANAKGAQHAHKQGGKHGGKHSHQNYRNAGWNGRYGPGNGFWWGGAFGFLTAAGLFFALDLVFWNGMQGYWYEDQFYPLGDEELQAYNNPAPYPPANFPREGYEDEY